MEWIAGGAGEFIINAADLKVSLEALFWESVDDDPRLGKSDGWQGERERESKLMTMLSLVSKLD